MPLLIALPPPALVAVCDAPPEARMIVTGKVDPWDVAPTFDLAELARMAQVTGRRGGHKPYGFYTGSVAYTVSADNADRSSCEKPVFIHVTMRLTSRHIGVAKDKYDDPCRSTAIVRHYRHHAEADEAVFRNYVTKVTATLTQAGVAFVIASTVTSQAPAEVPRAIDSLIEPVLADMDASRDAARLAVDTPSEIETLERACGTTL